MATATQEIKELRQEVEQLTAKLIDSRVPAWDVNLHCSKGVTVAIEQGDARLQEAFWESARVGVSCSTAS